MVETSFDSSAFRKGEDLPQADVLSRLPGELVGGTAEKLHDHESDKKDPVSEYNTLLWNNGTDAGKEQARKQKRKLTYMANIYVVKDLLTRE